MINAAVVGLGWWGRYIIGSLQGQSDAIRFVRAVDIDANAGRAFAEENGLLFSSDLEEALSDNAVDAVILTTPHSLHESQIVQAAAAGKHVFSEKPLALTKTGAIKAVTACEKAGLILGVGHERRFEPALLDIKDLIDTGALGIVQHVEANFSHDSLAGIKAGDWRASKAESPSGAMTAMGVHLTDSFVQMMGPIARVHAMTATGVTEWESGDLVAAHVKFASGATGSFSSLLATPFFMRYQVFGTGGWAEARDTVRPEVTGITHFSKRFKDAEVEIGEVETIDTVRANIESFAVAASGGRPYPMTDEEKVHNVAVLEAIAESAETGQPVTLG